MIYAYDNPNYDEGMRLEGTFLHGMLEDDMGYDIFSIDKSFDPEPGAHKMNVNNFPATFFLWKSKKNNSLAPWRGLFVYNHDTDMYQDALDKYYKQSEEL